ncbi:MAG TPA: Gfo/Idh/MocA family oxidoreductase [Nitrospirales bacterium]|nr:Gfo/Idh/MocA family oxidoreductase [Nitrospirales bacterium]
MGHASRSQQSGDYRGGRVSMSTNVVNVGVVGVGSFGQHHARIYTQHSEATLVGVLDRSPERTRDIAQRHGCEQFSDLDALLTVVDAVSIATPAAHHAKIATQCLERGVHVLVEKPIAISVDEARRCVALAADQKCIYQIGHLERFNSAMVAVQDLITVPHFIDSHRWSGFSGRSADVDVVLDLMIHDLDILLWLVGSEVEDVRASGVRVQSSSLDIATARIVFRNGCVANVSASRVSDEKVRTMTIAQPENVLILNHASGTVRVYPSLAQSELNEEQQVHEVTGHDDEPLWRELDSFLRCIQENTAPPVSGHDGLAALQLAHHVVAEIQSCFPSAMMSESLPTVRTG